MSFLKPDPKNFAPINPTQRPFNLGHVIGQVGIPFQMMWDDLRHHMAVLGGTGGGKSKFLELLCSYLLLFGIAGMFIDPHGDLSNELLAFLAHRRRMGDDTTWRRVHFLRVGVKGSFAFDPFANMPRRCDVSPREYHALLKAKVDRIVKA